MLYWIRTLLAVGGVRDQRDTVADALIKELEAIRSSRTPVIEFSAEGNVLWANDAFSDFFGYDQSNLIGRHHRIFCDQAFANSAEYREFWSRLRKGESQSGTFQRYRKDGAEVWIEATYYPVREPDGSVSKIVKLASDVTERIRQSAAESSILNALDRTLAIIEFQPDGTIIRANKNFLQTVGYELDQIRGCHHRMFCQPDFYRDNPAFWEDLANGTPCSGRFERVRSDGTPVWLEATYNPIFNAEGEVVRVIKFASDITERVLASKQTEDTLDLSQATAETALTVVSEGSAALGRAGEANQKVREAINHTTNEVASLRQMANEISKVTQTIRAVADKTNLLALNAAIEAARAGESGRGFSVVAEEIRDLAQQTSGATDEIADVIENNSQMTESLSRIAEQAKQRSESGMSQIEEALRLMGEIEKAADDLSSNLERGNKAAENYTGGLG
ncbi:PAS domain-containing methyl-accepting chemotaxis protein [Thioalkalivibrio sp. ALJ1]|uniref:methyl-accepting chemotaxis protein n=1 Tax=Thioalkalivibrio sp. ALJ1 TaxID=1158144 RepID=UPI000A9F86DC|nr:PAS domain-containing methyl-accepting chemotaxis protein [Thioalkalivibrio sp. ALJ1]